MSTNPLGKGSRNLSVNVPKALREQLEKLAAESNMSLSAYLRMVLSLAVEENTTLVVKREKKG